MKFRLWSTPPLLRSTDNFIPAVNTARFLQDKSRLLIVGDAGGRDHRYLSRQNNKEIYHLDIANHEWMPNLTIQSIEDPTPYEDNFFDGVVINEVLEHIFRDVDALEEIHRILKPDGLLVITVPYMSNVQDMDEFHVRVHSPKTMRRLLERCGFKIKEHFCRGIFCRFIELNSFFRAGIYLAIKAVELASQRSPEEATLIVNGYFERAERRLGQGRWAWVQKFSKAYGGILCAEKAAKKDFDALQIDTFGNHHLT
jgi:SAM-dependent methyltransferase